MPSAVTDPQTFARTTHRARLAAEAVVSAYILEITPPTAQPRWTDTDRDAVAGPARVSCPSSGARARGRTVKRRRRLAVTVAA